MLEWLLGKGAHGGWRRYVWGQNSLRWGKKWTILIRFWKTVLMEKIGLFLLLVLCGLLHLPSVDFFSVPSLKPSNIYMPFILYSNTCEEKDIFGADRIFLYDINIYTLFLGDHTFLILSSLIFNAYEGCYGCINCTTHGNLENSFLISLFIKV